MKWTRAAVLLAALVVAPAAVSQPLPRPGSSGFTLVALGTSGGLEEGHLSAFLLAPSGSTDSVALDAGTLVGGLQRAAARGSLSKGSGTLLDAHVRAVLLSHAHLDHVLGLVIASPDDAAKPVYGLPRTIDTLRDHLFNGDVWPNFGSEGAAPRLGRYRYVRLVPGEATRLEPTALSVEAYPLCHSGRDLSTAFLIGDSDRYVLYLGDTGPDAAEGCDRLDALWRRAAPLIAQRRLLGLVIEASYPDPRPGGQLFGHLTPSHLLSELGRLAAHVRPERPRGALAGLRVVVTHVKPSLAEGAEPRKVIERQLHDAEQAAALGVKFELPQDGDRIDLLPLQPIP